MELLAKIVNGFQPLTIFLKMSILDIWVGSDSDSDYEVRNFLFIMNNKSNALTALSWMTVKSF